MTNPDLDPVTAEDMLRSPDFADEHTGSSFADEQANRPGIGTDESTPSDRGGAGGLDPEAPIE